MRDAESGGSPRAIVKNFLSERSVKTIEDPSPRNSKEVPEIPVHVSSVPSSATL